MGSHERGLGLTLSKYLVFAQNFLFFAIGAAIIGVGSYLLLGGSIPGFSLVNPLSIAVVVIGSIVLVVSFFGCCGSARENRCMLGIYFVLVLILVIGTIIVGVFAFSKFFTINNGTFLEEIWDASGEDTKKWFLDNFHCCGFILPDNSTLCVDAKKIHPNITGCRDAIIEWVSDHLTITEIVAIVFSALLIVGLTLTCCLFCAIPSDEAKRKKEEKSKNKLIQDAEKLNQANYNSVANRR